MEDFNHVYLLLKSVFLNKVKPIGPLEGRLKQVLCSWKILAKDQVYEIPLLRKKHTISRPKISTVEQESDNANRMEVKNMLERVTFI